MRVAAALVALLATSACTQSSTPRTTGTPTVGPTSTAATSPAAPTSTASSAAACTNASVIASWSLARRAAAVVVVPVLNFDVAGVAPELRSGAGGLLLLGNASAPSDLAARVDASPHGVFRRLVMADEEGGGIQRLAPLVADFDWPQQLARTMTVTQVQALATRVGRQMRAAGVTVDLAPVLDVDARPGPSSSNPDGKRSFSGEASVASDYGVAFMQGLRAGGVVPVVKHFPGLGGSVGNTDVTAASTRPQLAPFVAAVRAGAPAVMVANASVTGVTPLPATLSRAVIGGMLRGQLGFTGLVVTDSLSAGAVQKATASLPEAVVRSLVAGADLMLFGSTLNATETARLAPGAVQRTFSDITSAIVAAVQSGRLPLSRLDAAVGHVVTAAGARLCG